MGNGDIPHFTVTIVPALAGSWAAANCYSEMRNVPISPISYAVRIRSGSDSMGGEQVEPRHR
jgi:hypothetical protein